MKIDKNKIGVMFFAIVGAALTLIVLYPYALEYLYLTDRDVRDFGTKEIILLSVAFFFFWGSAKFTTLAELIMEFWKSKIKK